jgi:hypothetical protein
VASSRYQFRLLERSFAEFVMALLTGFKNFAIAYHTKQGSLRHNE